MSCPLAIEISFRPTMLGDHNSTCSNDGWSSLAPMSHERPSLKTAALTSFQSSFKASNRTSVCCHAQRWLGFRHAGLPSSKSALIQSRSLCFRDLQARLHHGRMVPAIENSSHVHVCYFKKRRWLKCIVDNSNISLRYLIFVLTLVGFCWSESAKNDVLMLPKVALIWRPSCATSRHILVWNTSPGFTSIFRFPLPERPLPLVSSSSARYSHQHALISKAPSFDFNTYIQISMHHLSRWICVRWACLASMMAGCSLLPNLLALGL